MKKVLLLISFLTIGTVGVFAAPLVPFTFGGSFPNYENAYMTVGSGVYFPLQNNIELAFSGAFGIRTQEKSNGDIDADFFIPANAGVNFLFPVHQNLSFVAGFGVNAQMEFADSFTFLMGPFVSGGVRYRVHRNMQLTLMVQQDLLFGPPKWINTNTHVSGGIVVNFD
ncbi:MAG: hypothetical protein PQJ50_07840 [Spirochaetales bacterium]|nr:hypothetical protein [Spirochaetales bacterium]